MTSADGQRDHFAIRLSESKTFGVCWTLGAAYQPTGEHIAKASESLFSKHRSGTSRTTPVPAPLAHPLSETSARTLAVLGGCNPSEGCSRGSVPAKRLAPAWNRSRNGSLGPGPCEPAAVARLDTARPATRVPRDMDLRTAIDAHRRFPRYFLGNPIKTHQVMLSGTQVSRSGAVGILRF